MIIIYYNACPRELPDHIPNYKGFKGFVIFL